MKRLPHCKKPCKDCPFRKDSMEGWLGEARMKEILDQGSFVCHKDNSLQCAGHMLLKAGDNDFVQLAGRLHIKLDLSGRDLIFDDEKSCIKHHKY